MMLNDTYGDCTIAGAGHMIVAANALVNGSDPIPTDPEIQQEYFAETGGPDSGCVEADVLKNWYTRGLFQMNTGNVCSTNKIAGYAPVNPQSIRDVQQAIAFYGGCYIGVQLPQSAQQQFGEDDQWTVVPGSPIEGGHCILYVAYDAHNLYAVTWGAVIAVAYPWHAAYCDEAWAVVPQAFVEAGHGPTLDLKSLQSDISQL
jgi:hypothetical protein